jgi:hypothetical protein
MRAFTSLLVKGQFHDVVDKHHREPVEIPVAHR